MSFYSVEITYLIASILFVFGLKGLSHPDTARRGMVLAAAGMLREKAYKLVQDYAMRAWQEESDFRAAIESDPEIRAALGEEGIAHSFSLDRQLRHVDQIFARVLP